MRDNYRQYNYDVIAGFVLGVLVAYPIFAWFLMPFVLLRFLGY